MVALMHGANVLRVHDVAETIDIVKIFRAMSNKEEI
jgi:dihydropteroate synthase